MTHTLNIIGQAVDRLEATSRQATRGARIALAFGALAMGYGLVVVGALHGAGTGVFA